MTAEPHGRRQRRRHLTADTLQRLVRLTEYAKTRYLHPDSVRKRVTSGRMTGHKIGQVWWVDPESWIEDLPYRRRRRRRTPFER